MVVDVKGPVDWPGLLVPVQPVGETVQLVAPVEPQVTDELKPLGMVVGEADIEPVGADAEVVNERTLP